MAQGDHALVLEATVMAFFEKLAAQVHRYGKGALTPIRTERHHAVGFRSPDGEFGIARSTVYHDLHNQDPRLTHTHASLVFGLRWLQTVRMAEEARTRV